MSRLWISSDWHLGHNNIIKYRTQFETADEHHEYVLQQAKDTVGKRDTLWILGDVAFKKEWLVRIKEIVCRRKVIYLGNHDLERGIKIQDLLEVFDDVRSLDSHRNCWFSHAPVHPDEVRHRSVCIHGHTHDHLIDDERYINVCVEQTDFKPVLFADLEALRVKQIGIREAKKEAKAAEEAEPNKPF